MYCDATSVVITESCYKQKKAEIGPQRGLRIARPGRSFDSEAVWKQNPMKLETQRNFPSRTDPPKTSVNADVFVTVTPARGPVRSRVPLVPSRIGEYDWR
jgi:hypothetical protein